MIYGFTTVGTFAVAAWLARDVGGDNIEDMNGLAAKYPLLGVCMIVLMLSLIGVPPTAGFFGKLYMFMEALDVRGEGAAGLALVGLVALGLFNSVVSAFYYVRVLKAMYLRPATKPLGPPSNLVAVPIVLASAVVLTFGLSPSLLMGVMSTSAAEMLSSNDAPVAVFETNDAYRAQRAETLQARLVRYEDMLKTQGLPGDLRGRIEMETANLKDRIRRAPQGMANPNGEPPPNPYAGGRSPTSNRGAAMKGASPKGAAPKGASPKGQGGGGTRKGQGGAASKKAQTKSDAAKSQ